MSSDEEDYYYGSGDDDDVEEEDVDCSDEGPDCSSPVAPKSYTILNEDKIRRLQDEDVAEVCNVLSVSRAVAVILLCRKSWSVAAVFDEWFADEEKVRQSIGISSDQQNSIKQDYCKICFDSPEMDTMLSAACGHPFCADCLKAYVAVAVNDGPGCLSLRCPEPKCKARIGSDMIEELASCEDKEKYYRYLLRSYVEGNRKVKWCPAPGCEYAVQFDAGGSDTYEVDCDCSHRFCWNCLEETHRPVCCETVDKWIKQQTSEAENNTWIVCFTKPCPKCHRNIEKNQGCNHMTCGEPCGYEFCWLCLGDWKDHADRVCNTYEEEPSGSGPEAKTDGNKEEGDEEEEEDSIEAKRRYLVRYAHFYERWALNHKSRLTALEDMKRAKSKQIKVLARTQAEPEALLDFVMEAWGQIAECRRVLKWTYAYGYYLSMEKSGKTRFFQYLQGDAETALERLHHCVEKELEKYLNAESPMEDFKDFRAKLTCLIKTTKQYFGNLVRALENNLAEVENFAAGPDKTTKAGVMGKSGQQGYWDDPDMVAWGDIEFDED